MVWNSRVSNNTELKLEGVFIYILTSFLNSLLLCVCLYVNMDNRRSPPTNPLKLSSNVSADKRIAELEDIICTLKFELNGLKYVIATQEVEAHSLEAVKQEFKQKVNEVVVQLDLVSNKVTNRVDQLSVLEQKVYTIL